MIYAPLSYATRSRDFALASDAVLTGDGQAMVSVLSANGVAGVKPSTGAAGEKFVGFLRSQTSGVQLLPATAVKVEQQVLGSAGTYTLAAVPMAGTLVVHNVTTGATVASGDYVVDAAGNFTSIACANAEIRFTYTRALTVLAARSLVGDVQPGGFAGYSVGQAPVVQEGVVYTDMIDTSIDWSLATSVKLSTGGKLTNQAGGGVAISATIESVPTVDRPFLGLSFDA